MSETLHFKIFMPDIQPLIWRTFTVADDYRLDRFHQVIQLVMGWQNAHLHEFRIHDRSIGMSLDDIVPDPPETEKETTLFLRDFNLQEEDTFFYLYDFGDSWDHVLHIEKIRPKSDKHPLCTGGENACPPEDCVGLPGYMQLTEVFKNPNDDEYEELIAWLPKGFKPDQFPLSVINNKLQSLANGTVGTHEKNLVLGTKFNFGRVKTQYNFHAE